MNAMYAETVQPTKAPVKGAGKAEKSNKDKGKKKKKKKKESRGPLLIYPPLVFNPYRLSLPTYRLPDGTTIVNPDESEWVFPKSGTIRFRFGSLGVRKGVLDAHGMGKIIDAFADSEQTHAQRMEALDVHLGAQCSIRTQQVREILDAIPVDERNKLRERDLVLSRSALVVRCFHRLLETEDARDLLLLLDEGSRKLASKSLGSCSTFTRNNPTGFYQLNLENETERDLCLRLFECYNEQRARLRQLERDDASREGEVRMIIERVWRNLKLNNKAVVFEPSWRVPHEGRLQVDFVCINRPPAGTEAMPNSSFRTWLEDVLAPLGDNEDEVVAALRQESNHAFFSCEQVARLLCRLAHSVLRVEACVIAFSRTADFHNFRYVFDYLTAGEIKSVQSRIGVINLFDECMAVGYYDLDLSQPEHRWTCQHLLWLDAEEQGENIIDTCFEMVDFTVPPSWRSQLPNKGIFQCYYTRSSETVRAVRLRGSAVENRLSPSFWNSDTNSPFGQEAFSKFMPSWLQSHSRISGNELLHEPAGREWTVEDRSVRGYFRKDVLQMRRHVLACGAPHIHHCNCLLSLWVSGLALTNIISRWAATVPHLPATMCSFANRLRRIQSKLYEVFGDVQTAMQRLDHDGSGTVEVHELVSSLRSINVWMNSKQLAALLGAIDPDASGTISLDELHHFWVRLLLLLLLSCSFLPVRTFAEGLHARTVSCQDMSVSLSLTPPLSLLCGAHSLLCLIKQEYYASEWQRKGS